MLQEKMHNRLMWLVPSQPIRYFCILYAVFLLLVVFTIVLNVDDMYCK